MCRLKVKNYGDLNARLRRVHERITSNNPRMVQVLESIRQEPVLQNDFVEALAEQEGFDPLWMTQDAPMRRYTGFTVREQRVRRNCIPNEHHGSIIRAFEEKLPENV